MTTQMKSRKIVQKKPAKNDWFSAGSSISPDGKKFFCNHQDCRNAYSFFQREILITVS
ncbi:hypothetical protein B4168_1702 [Anoxybacillus flavithermus]|nr:hypothetical protein B4168_1702 [Anoxybacillus flavithermus]OAO84358.1 hypothetical protein GT23_3893 [Parageobacillus thermoglucosidasius]